MGVSWVHDIPMDLQISLPTHAAALARYMRPDELLSLLQSMALMKLPWNNVPTEQRVELLNALEDIITSLSTRELSNVVWSLGKLNVNYTYEITDSLKELLWKRLTGSVVRMKLFDLESVFVGLGSMQVLIRQ